jgi:phospholipase/carboxylesterase
VVALSGYIDENTLIPDYKENDHSHLKIYVSHGQVDPVIPLSWAQRSPPLLDTLGIDYTFEEYPTGHGVSPQNFYSLRTWLKDKI